MELKAKDYIYMRRDTERECELARQLRALPESERIQFLEEFIEKDILGLKLANACVREKSFFERLLRQGLEKADASSIFNWLECVAPRLGFNRVIAILTEEVERDPQAVDRAVYWLREFVPDRDPDARQALQNLITLVASKGGRGALINYQQQGIPVQETDSRSGERSVETRSGSLVFFGTEVPVQALFDAIAKGQTLHQFLARFPAVSRQQALAVISSAQEKLVESYKIAA